LWEKGEEGKFITVPKQNFEGKTKNESQKKEKKKFISMKKFSFDSLEEG